MDNINKLDNSLKPTKIYFTFDSLMSENAIKVSRKYLLNKINNKEVELKEFNDIKTVKEENVFVDKKILDKVIELMASTLNKDISEISPNSNFFFDLGGNSLDYYNLISYIQEEFKVEINLDSNSSYYTPVTLAKLLEELV